MPYSLGDPKGEGGLIPIYLVVSKTLINHNLKEKSVL
jgi:hypothetical protein